MIAQFVSAEQAAPVVRAGFGAGAMDARAESWLAWDDDSVGDIVTVVGLFYPLIRADGAPHPHPVLGLGHLATVPAYRGRGYAAALVREAERLGKGDLTWCVTFSSLDGFWEKLGYQHAPNLRGDLVLPDLRPYVKPLSGRDWPLSIEVRWDGPNW